MNAMANPTYPPLHLRQEQKNLEHRSFSPSLVSSLVAAGYPVFVERGSSDPSRRRVFGDAEYQAAGGILVPEGSWPHAAPGTVILGIKELPPNEDFALWNDHVAYMHCFKGQEGWRRLLTRFLTGGSVLYDLEFLVGEDGRRASAFSYMAGFVGAALAIKAWAWRLAHPGGDAMPGMDVFTEGRGYYRDRAELLGQIREDLAVGKKLAGGQEPKVVITGALGVCGRGAQDLFLEAGMPEESLTRWDLDETKGRAGPYSEILDHDIFLNAIYLSKPIDPFVTKELLARPSRRLGVIVDVSCDITSPYNPIPVYSTNTTFTNPTVHAEVPDDQNAIPVSVISIDHLPSILPRDASEAFSSEMREWLLQLKDRDRAPVWVNAEKVFEQKIGLLADEMRIDVENPKYSVHHVNAWAAT